MSRYLGELWQFVKVDTFIHLTSGKALYSLATGPFLCKFYTPWTILSFCKFNVIKPFQNKNISLTYYICKDTVDRIQYTNCNKNWNAICKSLFHSFFLGLLKLGGPMTTGSISSKHIPLYIHFQFMQTFIQIPKGTLQY